MKQTRLIMGMPITIEIIDNDTEAGLVEEIFNYFIYVDQIYSTYKPNSEISRINRGLPEKRWSSEVKHVLNLCQQTTLLTNGYFNIKRSGKLDPSGLVKGWAIYQASKLLKQKGIENFYIDAGGDIQVSGTNNPQPWNIGIRNPFNRSQIIKTLSLNNNEGVATSGTAIRGQHIYNPHKTNRALNEVISLTVVGPNIYEADRFATAAFAMGPAGINFIESLPGHEAYMVNSDKVAKMTNGFERYLAPSV